MGTVRTALSVPKIDDGSVRRGPNEAGGFVAVVCEYASMSSRPTAELGSVVLSLDAELGWGFHDLPSPPAPRYENARAGWQQLVSLFEEFDVRATWAVVGHLFLEECDGEHPGHPAPPDWFARERTSWRSRPDLRFGDGLIEALFESAIDHDIGSHTFSHVVFGDRNTDRTLADAEVTAAIEAAEGYDSSPTSFVYPRNRVGHRDVLADHGFTCYRGRAPIRPTDDLPGGRPLGKLIEATVDTPPLVTPRRDEFGLVNVPASMYLFGFEGTARSVAEFVWADPVVRRATRGIDAAARKGGICHLWLHPNNLVAPRDRRRMRAIVSHLAKRRDQGAVAIETMADVAHRIDRPSQHGLQNSETQ
jgi:peptidoglycan/xylan/chitin deacetylase (PgdA/CDA1 family)